MIRRSTAEQSERDDRAVAMQFAEAMRPLYAHAVAEHEALMDVYRADGRQVSQD